VHVVTRDHFRSRDGGDTNRSAVCTAHSDRFKDANGNVSVSGAIWRLNVKINKTALQPIIGRRATNACI